MDKQVIVYPSLEQYVGRAFVLQQNTDPLSIPKEEMHMTPEQNLHYFIWKEYCCWLALKELFNLPLNLFFEVLRYI